MANCMQLEIVTPDKLLFSSDEIVYLGLRTNDGGIGIEANHIPVIASLDIAPMKYRLADGTEGYVALINALFWRLLLKWLTILTKPEQKRLKNVLKSV